MYLILHPSLHIVVVQREAWLEPFPFWFETQSLLSHSRFDSSPKSMVIAGCSGTVFTEGSWSDVLKERTRSGKIAVPCGGWEEGALSSTCRERANGQGGWSQCPSLLQPANCSFLQAFCCARRRCLQNAVWLSTAGTEGKPKELFPLSPLAWFQTTLKTNNGLLCCVSSAQQQLPSSSRALQFWFLFFCCQWIKGGERTECAFDGV